MYNDQRFMALIRVIFTYDFFRKLRIMERPTRHSNVELALGIAL